MGRHPLTEGLPELLDRLWAERHLLEWLEFKLEAAKLFLASDVRRFFPPAIGEVECVIEQLREAEGRRITAVARVAAEWQVPADRVTLGYLVDRAPEPVARILAEHREAFDTLTNEIENLTLEHRVVAGDLIQGDPGPDPDGRVAVRPRLCEVEDLNVADVLMELQLQQVGFEAALSAMGNALPPSLADFLR